MSIQNDSLGFPRCAFDKRRIHQELVHSRCWHPGNFPWIQEVDRGRQWDVLRIASELLCIQCPSCNIFLSPRSHDLDNDIQRQSWFTTRDDQVCVVLWHMWRKMISEQPEGHHQEGVLDVGSSKDQKNWRVFHNFSEISHVDNRNMKNGPDDRSASVQARVDDVFNDVAHMC